MLRRHVLSTLVVVSLFIASPGFGQVLLQSKVPTGGKSKSQVHSRFDQKLNIVGMAQDTLADATIVSSTTYGTPTGDGELTVEVTIDSMVADMQLPGGLAFRYDTANPGPKNENAQLALVQDIYSALKGSTITYRVKDQKVVAVEGLQKIISAAPQTAADVLKTLLTTERVSQEFEQELGVLPTQPLNVGDSWMRTMVSNLDGSQTLTFDRKYEYTGTVEEGGKTLDQIKQADQQVRYALTGNPAVTLKASDLKIESSEGRILFDREQGAIVRDDLTTRLKGTLTLTAGGMDLPADLDLTVTRESKPVQ